MAVLYVSHRLQEVFDLCDRITVLKDGALVDTVETADITQNQLVRKMMGRSLGSYFPDRLEGATVGPVRLRVEAAGNRTVNDLSFEVCSGEIVGALRLPLERGRDHPAVSSGSCRSSRSPKTSSPDLADERGRAPLALSRARRESHVRGPARGGRRRAAGGRAAQPLRDLAAEHRRSGVRGSRRPPSGGRRDAA